MYAEHGKKEIEKMYAYNKNADLTGEVTMKVCNKELHKTLSHLNATVHRLLLQLGCTRLGTIPPHWDQEQQANTMTSTG